MSTLPIFEFSQESRKAERCLPIGVLAATDVSTSRLQDAVEPWKERALNQLRSEASKRAETRTARFDDFFKNNDFNCSLFGQMKRVKKKGFPRISPYVDTLLVCEMMSGLLMGVQDLNTIEGGLIYDVARGGESFQSVRDVVTCHPNEIVLRDERSIVASYFQGPNHRINVNPTTTSILFLIFTAPQLDEAALSDTLNLVTEIVAPSAREIEARMFAA